MTSLQADRDTHTAVLGTRLPHAWLKQMLTADKSGFISGKKIVKDMAISKKSRRKTFSEILQAHHTA